MNPKYNLFKHLAMMNGRYCDLKDKSVRLTKNERIYGLLMSMFDHWAPKITSLSWDNNKVITYLDCLYKLQLVEK